MKNIFVGLLSLLTLAIGLSTWLYFVRPTVDDIGLRHPGTQLIVPGDVTVTWLGVTTLLIDDGDTQLLIDGFFSRPALLDLLRDQPVRPDRRVIKAQLEQWEVNRLAAVMTVHSHFDHAMDIGEIAELTGALVLGSLSTTNIARGHGIDEAQLVEVFYDQPYKFAKFELSFYESKHAPLDEGGPPFPGTISKPLQVPVPVSEWKEGGSYTIRVRHPRGSFLVQGSAGFVPGALDGLDVDAVFLSVGGLSQMNNQYVSQYIEELVKTPGAEDIYLIHYEDFSKPFGTIELLPTGITMNKTWVFELEQMLLPSHLAAMEFGQPVKIGPYRSAAD